MTDNHTRGKEALSTLERELKARDRKEKTRPLGIAAVSLLAIIALVGGIWFLSTRDGSKVDNVAEATTTQEAPTEEPTITTLSGERAQALPETVTCEYQDTGREENKAKKPSTDKVPATGTVTVNFATNQGDIEMELDRAVAPCTVHAIADLVRQKYYDGSVCHRMTSGGLNVLQCGDPTGTGAGGPGFQFDNEYPTDEVKEEDAGTPVTYPKGSIAMANAGPGTNGSQFFINYEDSTLTPDYTYFGNLTATGLDTMADIAKIGVEGGASDGAPAQEIEIEKASFK